MEMENRDETPNAQLSCCLMLTPNAEASDESRMTLYVLYYSYEYESDRFCGWTPLRIRAIFWFPLVLMLETEKTACSEVIILKHHISEALSIFSSH